MFGFLENDLTYPHPIQDIPRHEKGTSSRHSFRDIQVTPRVSREVDPSLAHSIY